jgi:energy-coupling factor transporter ATP-binding protein EcfA2
LVDLSFAVALGETVLVLGPSGSGKSTLTLCLDGLIPHLVEGDYAGRVVVAGLVVGDSPVHLLTQETGLVFQDPDAQFCTLTVEDEIAFGLENLCRPSEEIEAAIDTSLVSVGLAGYRERRLDTLSGGEKQRVALAAVLAMGPRVLVLDEPSANLDPRATTELFVLLRRLAEDRRHTIVVIEHKLDELMGWVDKVLALDGEGHLLYVGDPEAAFYDNVAALSDAGVWLPQTVELVAALREIGWEVPGSPLSVADTVAALAATPGLAERLRPCASHSMGLSPGGEAGGGETPGRETVLETRHLSHSYRDGQSTLDALTDVSLTMRRGDFLAIAGSNGAGKSTLASLLTGVLGPPKNSVFFEGRDVTEMDTRDLSRNVGHVFQNPEHQFVCDTVFGELAYSLSPKAGRKGAHHLTAEQRSRVESWLDRLGLLPLAKASPFALSQGQKRRLSVAAMLIRGQSILVLDEPTLGQDESQAAALMALMQEFRVGGGTVAMITHDMRLVSEYADSLLVLSGGRALYAGSPEAFFSRPSLVEAAGLDVPTLGRVCAGLHERAGTLAGLLTARDFLRAAARDGGDSSCRGASPHGGDS